MLRRRTALPFFFIALKSQNPLICKQNSAFAKAQALIQIGFKGGPDALAGPQGSALRQRRQADAGAGACFVLVCRHIRDKRNKSRQGHGRGK